MIIFSAPNVDHRSYMGIPLTVEFARELIDAQYAHDLAIGAVLGVLGAASAGSTMAVSVRQMLTAPGIIRKVGGGLMVVVNGYGVYLVTDMAIESISKAGSMHGLLSTLIREYSYTTVEASGHECTVVNTWVDRAGLRLINRRLARRNIPPMKWGT